MKTIRKTGNKKIKKFCIYIYQEEEKDGKSTTIDYIGDEELLGDLETSILEDHLRELIHKRVKK